MSERFIVKRADECAANAIVIPFIDEPDAREVADALNAKSDYHLTHSWARGPASKYVYEDGDVAWCVLDTTDTTKDRDNG